MRGHLFSLLIASANEASASSCAQALAKESLRQEGSPSSCTSCFSVITGKYKSPADTLRYVKQFQYITPVLCNVTYDVRGSSACVGTR
jgi:hypothetical protein